MYYLQKFCGLNKNILTDLSNVRVKYMFSLVRFSAISRHGM